MTIHMTRGQTVNLNQAVSQNATQAPVRPVVTTREGVKMNDLDSVLRAIKVFGVK